MHNTQEKQWALDEVCDQHGYDDLDSMGIDPHVTFINWLKEYYNKKEVGVVDVGCGSGRLLKFLPENVKRYIGVDINQKCINTAKDYFDESDDVKFHLFDIEEENLKEVVDSKIDIIYFDSTFTLLYKPLECLSKLFEFCDVVYLGRTPYNELVTSVTPHRWDGMNSLSSNWKFSRRSLEETVPNGWNVIDINQTDVILKRNFE